MLDTTGAGHATAPLVAQLLTRVAGAVPRLVAQVLFAGQVHSWLKLNWSLVNFSIGSVLPTGIRNFGYRCV